MIATLCLSPSFSISWLYSSSPKSSFRFIVRSSCFVLAFYAGWLQLVLLFFRLCNTKKSNKKEPFGSKYFM
jgi:hypothetical protein